MTMLLRNGFLAIVLLFLSFPLIVMAGVSLNAQKSVIFPPQGLSLTWYGELFTEPGWLLPMQNSVSIALAAAAIAVSIALPLAYSGWRFGGRYTQTLFYIGLAPATLPPVITAVGLLSFWAAIGYYGRVEATILSHAIFLMPLPLVLLALGMRTISPQLVEAASTLGANELTIFRTIVFPLILPYLLAGYAFAFVLSLNEYIISYMVAGFTVETLPIKIFNSLHYGYTPVMACATMLFVLLGILTFSLISRFSDLPNLIGGLPEQQRSRE